MPSVTALMDNHSAPSIWRGASLNLELGTQHPTHTPHGAYQVVLRLKDYGDGEAKLLASLYPEGAPRPRPRGCKSTGDRASANHEHMLRAASRARQEVNDAVMMIRANRMGTLAIRQNGDWRPTTETISQVMHELHRLTATVPDQYGKLWPIGPLVCVIEHTNKAGEPFVHGHVAFRSDGYENWRHWYALVNQALLTIAPEHPDPHATFSVTLERKRPRARIALYMTKYLTKQATLGELNKRRFFRIDCPKPQVERVTLPRSRFGINLADELAHLLAITTGRPTGSPWYGTVQGGIDVIVLDTLRWNDAQAADDGAVGAPPPPSPHGTAQDHPGLVANRALWETLIQWAAADNLRTPSSPDEPPPDAGCTCWMCRKGRPRKTSGPPS